MAVVKKFLPFLPLVSAVFFALTFISVFMNWESVELFGIKVSTSLWDSEAGARIVILFLSVVGIGVSVAAFVLKNKFISLGNALVAFLTMGMSVLYIASEKSDANDLDVDFGIGIGYVLALLSLLAVMAISAATFVLSLKDEKKA